MAKQLNKDMQDRYMGQEPIDLVCFSHLRWDFVYQRPQHLMSRFALERRVFYVEEPVLTDEKTPHYEMINRKGVIVVKPFLPEGLDEEQTRAATQQMVDQLFVDEKIEQPILWFYTPMSLAFTRHLDASLVIYDCMDELSMFKDAPPALKAYEDELFQWADLVFTGGFTLFESKRNKHNNIHSFPSSIDANHFRRALKKQAEPKDQANIPHPRLGFFGVIDERMDINLLAEVAKMQPDWHLVILGPTVKIDPASLPAADNIHYLGMKSYEELPAYLSGWDVALLPFAMNDSTRFISPTKIPEYLAGGRAVVSAPIRDVVHPYGDLNLVSIAETPEEFVRETQKLLRRSEQEISEWTAKVENHLSQNSWDYTWKKMLTLIESAIYARQEEDHNKEPGKDSSTRGSSIPFIPIDLGLKKMNGGQDERKANKQVAFDYLIVGAGFAGSVLAERLAVGSGKKVLLIDKRPHIGGNAYDYYSPEGLLIHKYGPHIFHTNSIEVLTYLSQFTEWRPYQHRVLASVDGQLVPMPINLDTINQLYGVNLNAFELKEFFEKLAEPRKNIITSEDVVVSKVGQELYEKFFRNYTRKQWGLDPSELDASVTSRVPIRYNRDGRYFTDTYQVMPLMGYTRMFERLLDHPNIKIMLNTDYHEIIDIIPYREMIFTGPVDEYFDFAYGKLPYRSLQFEFKTLNEEQHQPVAVINYPNDYLYTRVTEFKHLTGQVHPKTSLVYEYPSAEGDPYYPIPRPQNAKLYTNYQKLAEKTSGVYFAGRLATYKYYNMDQVVAQALKLYSKIQRIAQPQAAAEHTSRYSAPVKLPKKVGQDTPDLEKDTNGMMKHKPQSQ
jgi:UDP-galactopyranose mutase